MKKRGSGVMSCRAHKLRHWLRTLQRIKKIRNSYDLSIAFQLFEVSLKVQGCHFISVVWYVCTSFSARRVLLNNASAKNYGSMQESPLLRSLLLNLSVFGQVFQDLLCHRQILCAGLSRWKYNMAEPEYLPCVITCNSEKQWHQHKFTCDVVTGYTNGI